MKVECVDGVFSKDQLAFYAKHGVVVPTKGTVYTVDETRRHSDGSVGYILVELKNPKVPINHDILNVVMMEIAWDVKRFREIQDPLQEEVEEVVEEELQLEEVY